ncbi:CHC2 zinc finger domain-containing protein [Clostridium sp.]|uniref:CHC2 zinc finger domain-containing protein n=1 Tax=Clostridium sp. TaxID=1506 RepID=UPI0039957BB4
MTRFEVAKNMDITSILENYGYLPNAKGKYLCPVHKEKTPSAVVYKNKLKCFGCGQSLSTIDIVQYSQHCTSVEAVNIILSKSNNDSFKKEKNIKPIKEKTMTQTIDIDYLRQKSKVVKSLEENKYIKNYFSKRCILRSSEALKKFNVLIRHNYYNSVNYVIYDFGDYMIQKSLDRTIKRNVGHVDIFIMEYNSNFPYYIVEGIEDCLSLLEALKNINIICLNSVSNKNKLMKFIEENENYKKSKFVFALDYDKAGKTTGKEIKEFFIKNNIEFSYYSNFYRVAQNTEIKDVNEYLIYKIANEKRK